MIVIMKSGASQEDIQAVVDRIEENNLSAHLSQGQARTIVGIIGRNGQLLERELFQRMSGVERVVRVQKPFKLGGRDFHPQDTVFDARGVRAGGGELTVIAGPCSVESRSQIIETAQAVKEAGAHMLRGGAFKPRTSPYSFQGLGQEGLEYLAEASAITGLPVVTEVMEPGAVALVCEYADVLQIGTRNMQNYALLHEVGRSQHPVLLKRGMSSLIEEWLMCAEYILSHGNSQVMLCERGIRTFEKYTRNTFDLNAIPVAKQYSHLPVIADPSHATGNRDWVPAAARAAVAAGADGLIIEVHPDPEQAMSDGQQSLTPEAFGRLVGEMKAIAEVMRRSAPVVV
jgi:3-deoxy-7-phosphoheptulonate synthase